MNRWYVVSAISVILGASGETRGGIETKHRSFGEALRNCSPASRSEGGPPTARSQDLIEVLRNCAQRRALVAMDALLADDVIPVIDGIDLVRFKRVSARPSDRSRGTDSGEAAGARDAGLPWATVLLARFARIFRTHVLKIDVDQLSRLVGNGTSVATTGTSSSDDADAVQGRRRRHRRRHHAMSMVMMGVLIMGSVLVPMGFQFLAVLGGKALILAKLALMLSSIQGLKKIATSGVNYGLYHSPEGWHERSHQSSGSGHFEIPYQTYPSHSAAAQQQP